MSRLLYGLFLVLLVHSCGDEPTRATPSRDDSGMRDSLAAVVHDYDQLNITAALEGAQRLRWQLEHTAPAVETGLRTDVYQYLALLHYDRSLYPDSIHFYADTAAALLAQDAPPERMARQMLSHAYSNWFHFAYLEMDMAAELGKQWLETADQSDSELYAALLIAQGVARKKITDPLPPGDARQAGFATCEALFRRAAELYRRAGSDRYRQALDELAILYARFPDGRQRAEKILAELRTSAHEPLPYFGLPDRILGYHAGVTDSATVYYGRLLEGPELQNFKYRTEAGYRLMVAAQMAGDYEAALHELWREMQDAGCCPDGYTRPGGEEPFACTTRPACNFYLAARATVYLERYLDRGAPADLQAANALCRAALDDYERSFQTAKEESVLNKINEIGHRLLGVALNAAVLQALEVPSEPHATSVLRAMEMGKTFLLTRDILEADVTGENGSANDQQTASLQQLRVDINLLKERYGRDFTLPREDLREFFRLTTEYRQQEARMRAGFTAELDGFAGGMDFPDLNDIRAGLGPDQVFLEYAETDSSLYGLFVNCDTFRVFPVDTSVRHLSRQLTERLTTARDTAAAAYSATAGVLYHHLLGPVADMLPAGGELLVVPSLSLNTVPFAALTTRSAPPATGGYAGLDYVLDHYGVRYLPSWRVDRQLQPGRLDALPANPVVGAWTHPELQFYLAPLGENLVNGGAAGSEHYLGGSNVRSNFLQEAGNYDLLHLSVHARGNPRRLYDNYLYLTARDSLNGLHIGPRDLRARLVVLAACSTAQGHANRGEGTFSLTRSFHLAGVPDVVGSLYDVPALATGRVLEQFYTYLRSGYSPAASLTLAQRQCRSGTLGNAVARPQQWGGLIVG